MPEYNILLFLVVLETQRYYRAGFGVIGNISQNIFGPSFVHFKM